MKIIGQNIKFRIYADSDTGYNNGTCMTVLFSDGLALYFPMRSHFKINPHLFAIGNVREIILNIPSGKLTIYPEDKLEINNEGYTTINNTFIWEGKLAGYFGGMSGYASFDKTNLTEEKVVEGLFLINNSVVTLDEYLQIKDKFRELLDWQNSDDYLELEKAIATNTASEAEIAFFDRMVQKAAKKVYQNI